MSQSHERNNHTVVRDLQTEKLRLNQEQKTGLGKIKHKEVLSVVQKKDFAQGREIVRQVVWDLENWICDFPPRLKVGSSTGRAAVSKTAGCRFDSCPTCPEIE